MKHNTSQRHGFTLVELLAVVTVVAILTGLILATTAYVKRKMFDLTTKTQMQAIIQGLELYKADWGYFPVTPFNWPRVSIKYHDYIGDKPYSYRSSYTNTGTVLANRPMYLSNSLALYRALMTKPNYYPKTNATNIANITILDNDNGYTTNFNVIIDSYGNPWGYFNTVNDAWRPNQFNQASFDLWSCGAMTFSYYWIQSNFNPANAICNWLTQ